MKYHIFAAAALFSVCAASLAAEQSSEMSDESSPETLAAYEAQCKEKAIQEEITEEDRAAYVADCVKQMPDAQSGGGTED